MFAVQSYQNFQITLCQSYMLTEHSWKICTQKLSAAGFGVMHVNIIEVSLIQGGGVAQAQELKMTVYSN